MTALSCTSAVACRRNAAAAPRMFGPSPLSFTPRPSSAERFARPRDDLILRLGREIGMHRQAHHEPGDLVAHRKPVPRDGIVAIGRLLVQRLWIVDGGGNAGGFQVSDEGVALAGPEPQRILRPDRGQPRW